MKILVVAALTLCVAVQVFAEPITEDKIKEATAKCTRYNEEGFEDVDYDCYFTELEVVKNYKVDKNKLEEYLKAKKMDNEKIQKLIKLCADKTGQELYGCVS